MNNIEIQFSMINPQIDKIALFQDISSVNEKILCQEYYEGMRRIMSSMVGRGEIGES